MMRAVLATLAAAAILLFAAYERQREDHEKFIAEHRYIYGFGILRGQSPFADYLEQVTAEGLREIRWDHKPKTLIATSATTGTWSTIAVSTAATSTWIACTQPAIAYAIAPFANTIAR